MPPCPLPSNSKWFTVLPAPPRAFGDIPEVVINFGKYKGARLEAVVDRNPEYAVWLLVNVEMPDAVYEILEALLNTYYEERDQDPDWDDR